MKHIAAAITWLITLTASAGAGAAEITVPMLIADAQGTGAAVEIGRAHV